MPNFRRSSVSFLVLALSTVASAQLITFETTPGGGTPVDNQLLTTPYNLTGGGTVFFFFDRNGNNTFEPGIDIYPSFELVGGADPIGGFYNQILNAQDTALPAFASQLGNFFIRPSNVPNGSLVVDYNTTQIITELSGEIWDIDADNTGTEAWRVDALDASNNVLASTFSPVGTSTTAPLDGRPWVFGFTGLPSTFDKIRIDFIGTKPSVGLAFNNFNPTFSAVPETSTIVMMGLASGAMALVVRRRRG